MATEESMAIISSLDEGVSTDDVINGTHRWILGGATKLHSRLSRKCDLTRRYRWYIRKLDTKYDNWDGSI